MAQPELVWSQQISDDDHTGSSGWAFAFLENLGFRELNQERLKAAFQSLEVRISIGMIRRSAKFRKVDVGAVCALTLTCALLAAASPRQDSPENSSAKAAPTHSTGAKKTTSTSAQKHHSASSKSTGKHSSHKKSSKVRGQQKIDSGRALAIQQALIREHYLTGEPSGTWNQASEDAMRKFQADHGWQSKTVPDSRALISLGLGPSKDHLLNPESAMTTVPDSPKSDPVPASSHTAPATSTPLAPTSATPAASSTPTASDPSSPQ